MAKKVQFSFETNAKQLRGELYQMNAHLRNINDSLHTMNSTGTKGAKSHASAMAGLALRFVGYNLVLNQVMGAQQKLYEYVKESITKFREFETRIAEVSTIMGKDFTESIYGLQAGVEALSVTFGKNTSDMSKGLYDIMSAAFDAKEAIALLGTATQAAIAGLADVRESVDIFTTVLNTYGMSAYEATKVSDTLFQSVVRGKFQFRDLESALGYVVPIAAQAGIEFEELMGVLSTATRHGLHLDMASRGLALGIQGIINPSVQAAKAAQKYGIQMDALTLRLQGLQGFFKVLNEKSKEYGKIVLNELVPNMRSLRVAMVLAGDEGVAGLADDMDKLALSAGRTEEALGKITETSQFVANQIDQRWEQTQRDVGKGWDEIALKAKGGATEAVTNWKSFLPIIGPIFTALDAGHKQELVNWKSEKNAQYHIVQGEIHKYDTMKKYLQVQEEIGAKAQNVASKMQKGEDFSKEYDQLLHLQELSVGMQDSFNRAFGEPIVGGIRNLETLQTTLSEIEADVDRLREQLVTPVSVGWGSYTKEFEGQLRLTVAQKKAEQERVDTVYDVNMAMKESSYVWKTNNAQLKEAVTSLREHEKALKSNKKATEELNRAMLLLQIQALEIQIKGMMRRRGLTRNEQKQLKQIQIEQAKLRLEGMKNQVDTMTEEAGVYDEKKEFIDSFIRALKHEEYTLKYTMDNEISELETTLGLEEQLLQDRLISWTTTNDEIAASSLKLSGELKTIMDDPELLALFDLHKAAGIDIGAMSDEAAGTHEASKSRSIFDMFPNLANFSRGIEYMPETKPVMIHAGESIVSAGKDVGGGGVVIQHVDIHVKQIADINSVEKLAALTSEAKDKKVFGRRGDSNYRIV
jgi:TP901 family phage tail tape measure protein